MSKNDERMDVGLTPRRLPDGTWGVFRWECEKFPQPVHPHPFTTEAEAERWIREQQTPKDRLPKWAQSR